MQVLRFEAAMNYSRKVLGHSGNNKSPVCPSTRNKLTRANSSTLVTVDAVFPARVEREAEKDANKSTSGNTVRKNSEKVVYVDHLKNPNTNNGPGKTGKEAERTANGGKGGKKDANGNPILPGKTKKPKDDSGKPNKPGSGKGKK